MLDTVIELQTDCINLCLRLEYYMFQPVYTGDLYGFFGVLFISHLTKYFYGRQSHAAISAWTQTPVPYHM